MTFSKPRVPYLSTVIPLILLLGHPLTPGATNPLISDVFSSPKIDSPSFTLFQRWSQLYSSTDSEYGVGGAVQISESTNYV